MLAAAARVLRLLAGLLPATLLLLAGLLRAAALLVLATLSGIVGVLRILWVLVHDYSLQLPQPQFRFDRSQSKSSIQ